jgi:hypothetical protein
MELVEVGTQETSWEFVAHWQGYITVTKSGL